MFLNPDRDIQEHRDRLPHWDQEHTLVFLTWRLADSLPTEVITKIHEKKTHWLTQNPKPWTNSQAAEFNRSFVLPLEDKLDDHHGGCVLRKASTRKIVADAFHYFEKERYKIDCHVIMPNHVHLHLQLKPDHSLGDVVHSLKSFTATAINKQLGNTGRLWQRDYWDRLIRSEKHLYWSRNYMANNPENLQPSDFTLLGV